MMKEMDDQSVIPPTPSQPQPEEPVISSPNVKQLIILIIILFLLLIVVGVTVYYFGARQIKKQTNIIPTQTQAPTTVTYPTQTVTIPDETANWKTYTDYGLKFSFKYPNDWSISSCIQNNKQQETGTKPCEKGTYYMRDNDLKLLKVTSLDNTNGLELVVSKNIPTPTPTPVSDNDPTDYQGVPSKIVYKPDVIIGGISSKRFSATGPGSVTIHTATRYDDLIFYFKWDEVYWDQVAQQKADKIYEQILNSFKFL